MERHYALRNKIARAKLKRALAKIQALNKVKEKDKHEFLTDVFLQASQT